jgi:uncharacterized RDD family membrane protein YckC
MDGDEPGNAEAEDGLTARLGRMALRPARAAARSGRSALSGEAERAIDGVLAGPLPESIARSIVEHHVVERVLAEWLEAVTAGEGADSPERARLERAVEEALASPALQQRLSAAVSSRLTETLAEQVVRSAAFRTALSNVLESPEVRGALAHQTAGLGADVAESLRGRARALDDAAGREKPSASEYGGLAARGVAIVVDAVLAHLAFLVAAGAVALVASLVSSFHSSAAIDSLLGAGWLLAVVAYFVLFWTTTGQTPGMRLMRLRVLTATGVPPSLGRSLVRFAGLVVAIVPFFAGFVPVLFDGRRRALQDYAAGTAVVAEPGP